MQCYCWKGLKAASVLWARFKSKLVSMIVLFSLVVLICMNAGQIFWLLISTEQTTSILNGLKLQQWLFCSQMWILSRAQKVWLISASCSISFGSSRGVEDPLPKWLTQDWEVGDSRQDPSGPILLDQ